MFYEPLEFCALISGLGVIQNLLKCRQYTWQRQITWIFPRNQMRLQIYLLSPISKAKLFNRRLFCEIKQTCALDIRTKLFDFLSTQLRNKYCRWNSWRKPRNQQLRKRREPHSDEEKKSYFTNSMRCGAITEMKTCGVLLYIVNMLKIMLSDTL